MHLNGAVTEPRVAAHSSLQHTKQRPSWGTRPTGVYFTETVAARRNYMCGACTGLRNTPTPSTLTSTTSPATSGPTPAGVPVAIKSPGLRVMTREIQRTRNDTG